MGPKVSKDLLVCSGPRGLNGPQGPIGPIGPSAGIQVAYIYNIGPSGGSNVVGLSGAFIFNNSILAGNWTYTNGSPYIQTNVPGSYSVSYEFNIYNTGPTGTPTLEPQVSAAVQHNFTDQLNSLSAGQIPAIAPATIQVKGQTLILAVSSGDNFSLQLIAGSPNQVGTGIFAGSGGPVNACLRIEKLPS